MKKVNKSEDKKIYHARRTIHSDMNTNVKLRSQVCLYVNINPTRERERERENAVAKQRFMLSCFPVVRVEEAREKESQLIEFN